MTEAYIYDQSVCGLKWDFTSPQQDSQLVEQPIDINGLKFTKTYEISEY